MKLTYLSVYDIRDCVSEDTSSPSPPSSITHVHRCIRFHNGTRQTLSTSAKLKYLSVYDSRDGVSEHVSSPSPPSSLTHVHRCIGSRNGTRQTDAAYLCETDTLVHPQETSTPWKRGIETLGDCFHGKTEPLSIHGICIERITKCSR